jgi:preprotein translocase subunit SecE
MNDKAGSTNITRKTSKLRFTSKTRKKMRKTRWTGKTS